MSKSQRTAFIRVTAENQTKDGLRVFTLQDIENTLNEWAHSAQLLYYFIEHPADDEISKTHYHILIRFKSPMPFDAIKKKFPVGDIETAKNVKNCIQYMVHLNDESKKPYSWDCIHTNDPDKDWYKVQSFARQEVIIQRVLDAIKSGEISEYDQCEKIPMEIWTKHKTRIANAFAYQRELICMDKSRHIDVVYVGGESGLGKTSFAKEYCDKSHLRYCVSSASNDPLQDYKGEDVLILDDLRDDAFSYSDLLKLLDNHTRSSGKSRYYNKAFVGSMIIITSSRPLCDLYYDLPRESKHQLYRRISTQYQFTYDKILQFVYDERSYKYKYVGFCSNDIPAKYEAENHKPVDMLNALGKTFIPAYGKSGETLNTSESHIEDNRKTVQSSIQEATEEEKMTRKEYEASLPPVNWDNVNKHRIG